MNSTTLVAPQTAATATDRWDHLASMRGLAAIVVFIAHAVQIFWLRFVGLHGPLHEISSAASYYAVVAFFLLSGFLIAQSGEENLRRNEGFGSAEFFAARVARVYPPFIFAVLLTCAVYWALVFWELPGYGSPMRLAGDLYAARDLVALDVRQVGMAVVMLTGMFEVNGPLWSLFIEVKLYVLFGCVLGIASGKRAGRFVVALGIAAYLSERYNPEFWKYSALWVTGAFFYYLLGAKVAWRLRKLLIAGVFVAAIAALDLLSDKPVAASTIEALRTSILADVIVGGLIACLLFLTRLRVPYAERVAPWSYSLYVIHFPILLFAQSLAIKYEIKSYLAVVAVTGLAMICATCVSLAGGVLEAQKPSVQAWLLRLGRSDIRR